MKRTRTNRANAALLRFLTEKLNASSEKVAMQAADRLTEILLAQEITRQKQIDRETRKLRAQAAQEEPQGTAGTLSPSQAQNEQGPSLDELVAGNPEAARALANYKAVVSGKGAA